MKLNKVLRKGTAILLIFAVWQFACFKTGNEILLPSPERVFAVLLEEVQKERSAKAFWQLFLPDLYWRVWHFLFAR